MTEAHRMRLDRLRPVTWLQAIALGLIAVSGSLLAPLTAIVVNGGSLPGPFSRYRGLAWLALGLVFFASVVAAVREHFHSHNVGTTRTSGDQLPQRPRSLGQLPAEIREFTGRGPYLQKLRELVRKHAETPASGPLVVAICGHAGTGKSVLAIHFAHELFSRYPDAHLYVDLRRPSAGPPGTLEVLDHLVRGLTGGGGGAGVDSLKREYRAGLRNKRAVIVLDNAEHESQVRPLIPESPTCLVLITSQRPLDELEHSHLLHLGDMSPDDAVELLVRIAGDKLLLTENQAATKEVAARCSYLPLALSIAGVQLRGHDPREVAARLADERSRLQLLELEEGERGVRASLDISYERLSGDQRALFRRLKLLPEPSFDASVAAALMEVPVAEAEKALDALVDHQVLEWVSDGRYGFIDLIGVFAIEKLENEEPLRERNDACERALHVYLTEATRRAALLEPAIAELSGDTAPSPTSLEQQLDALDWFERERPTLLMAGRRAAEIQAHDVTWRLAAALVPFLDVRGHRADWADLQRGALAAAQATRKLDDQVWTSLMAGQLGWLERRHDEARWHLEEALEGAHAGGWPRLQARALYLMGRVDHESHDLDGALERYNRAATILAADDGMLPLTTSAMLYAATALHERGSISDDELRRLAGTARSAMAGQQADLWTVRTTGWIEEYLARLARRAGDLEHAGAHCLASEQAFRRIGFRHGQGRALRELGVVRQAQANPGRARQLLEESVAIFDAIGDGPEADEARTLLRAIPANSAASP